MSENKSKQIIIVAGEASGDMHGSYLINEIKKIDPSIRFSGLGGSQIQASGAEIYYDLTKLAVIGFYEVLKHYKEIKKAFNLILKVIKESKPAAVILIDYPGFNLRLAEEIKKLKIDTKVIYYISPQIWAWKKNRIKAIKKNIDKMLVLFDFEEKIYLNSGVTAKFVGHPLVDEVKSTISKEDFLESLGLSSYKMTIGILPGSREKEVQRHLPLMLGAAKILKDDYPMMQFIVIKAPTISESLIKEFLPDNQPHIKIIGSNTYDAINSCESCMVASGTATLETAILCRPMVVVYKTSWLTWILAKLFLKIPNIGLVNVVAQKRIVPECIQLSANPNRIASEISELFTNEIRLANIKNELKKVATALGTTGASRNAAKEVINMIFPAEGKS
ncbi:MAG: lipid-A-disaccharide synthase [Omnitrophica WOR_2 bacterium GWF2_38_59]|nr:MAG: lipid-A-disaccharide synthase [Omnitrophica WOR_2 bacterium GWA2_37_7]OGX23862.1 MAG: lipid-A-disaccharide synthase [Omnitrophica WOR_2 bacterium GWF2_38_59]OGX47804.1 MAG: lipid-A-disaccharide synthase [Omnitrophica WOR_2 bacterium RIFOXYA2_FULL_38_17]OGX54438.1 MAG: lipid-A-disaccharide synthase [Omnitrophica WOR_2 bacterium RIFOXYA12_FULL_38_10]OGX56055.1 MAG: lipid-A-disaccharide synthase [Omnitrophica WOR_2 bacterium RIFOXYB2_FULL_38_16]OGX56959.1 MAG: lipid-A-disaccharide synthas